MARKRQRPEKHLDEPGHKIIRRQAEKLLDKTDAAVRRLRDPADTEALHDTRVALRRLRGWFQAIHGELRLKDTQRRQLKRLAHSTNQARDAEVGIEWLTRQRRQAHRRSGADTACFLADLRGLRDHNYRTVRRELPPAWRKLSRKLTRVATDVDSSPHPFRRDFAASLRSFSRDFEQARIEARRSPTPPHIHALRIAGKKVRYLTETVLRRAPMAAGLLREMKALHDSAGAIQDLQRLQALSEELLLVPGNSRHPERAPDTAPYVRVGREASREQSRRIARFRKTYLGPSQPRCLRELHGLMRKLKD